MNRSVLRVAADLADRGEPFVLATVVWRRGPSSGKQGSTAIITPDGGVHGWLGGACAEPTVVREALAALGDGAPRLMFLGIDDAFDERARPGITTVPMACASEGAMEVYVEPVLPKPQVVVIGRSPAVNTLVALARSLEWRTVVVDDGGDPADHPGADRVLTTLDLSGLGIDERSFIPQATRKIRQVALERLLGVVAHQRR